MDVSAINQPTASAAAQAASGKLAENFDTFLHLLVAQLQNQDPLQPTDTKEFVQELVQFSQVEQQIGTNTSLDKLLQYQSTGQTAAAINYLGSTIEANGNTVPLQDGKAEFSYALPEQSTGTVIVLSDSSGQVVYSAPGETEIGKHSFVWDGQDSNGNQLPEGNYTIAISARNADNDTIEVPTSIFGRVTGVESTTDGALITIGGVHIPLSDILSVKQTVPAT